MFDFARNPERLRHLVVECRASDQKVAGSRFDARTGDATLGKTKENLFFIAAKQPARCCDPA